MISLTLGDVSFDRIDLNSKLANAFTYFYFDLGKNTKKYIKSGPIRVKNCEFNPSSSNIDQEKIRFCKTYDIDGIFSNQFRW